MSWDRPYQPARNKRLDPDLYARAGKICFITIRAYRSSSPFVRDVLKRLVVDTLREEAEDKQFDVFTFCVMPDHLHYLITPRRDGLSVSTFTDRYKSKTTNGSWKVDWKGKLWQPRFWDHIVREEEDLLAIDQYIQENPVRKGLVNRVHEWPWSGLMNPLPL